MRSPHIFTRKSRLQPGEFLITSAKRLLQHNLPEAVIPAPCVVRSTRCTRAVVARRWKAHVPGRRHGSNLILKKLIFHPVLTHASRRAHHVLVAHRKNVGRKSSHEGLVSHRSAVRSRDLRNDPHLSASNATWCRTER